MTKNKIKQTNKQKKTNKNKLFYTKNERNVNVYIDIIMIKERGCKLLKCTNMQMFRLVT